MPGLPVAVNSNLDRDNAQLPIASNSPVGALGGIKADGTTINVNQATGVASVAGAGGGTLTGTLTPGKIPVATAAHVLGDSHLDDGLTHPVTITSSEKVLVNSSSAATSGNDEIGLASNFTWNPTVPSVSDSAEALKAIANVDLDGQADASGGLYGVDCEANNNSNTVALSFLEAFFGFCGNEGNGNVASMWGIDLELSNDGGGVVADAVGAEIESIANTSGGSITSAIGVRVEDQTVGTSLNRAIKTGIGPVEFGDSLILDPMTSDPSSLTNGEIWYNGTEQSLNARINGATVALGPGGAFSITQKLTVPGVFNFPSIPQTKNTLVIDFIGNSNGGFDSPWLQFNGDVGEDYTYYFTAEGASSSTVGPSVNQTAIFAGLALAASAIPNTSVMRIIIPGYTDSSLHKNVFFHAAMPNNGPGSFYYIKGGGVWLPATDAPITSLLFQMNPNDITSGFFAAGSICTISGQ